MAGRIASTRIATAVRANNPAAIHAGAQRSAVHPPSSAPPMAMNASEK